MDWYPNRYMLDTSSLNIIIENNADEFLIYQSKLHGFEYYFAETQSLEAVNNITDKHQTFPDNAVPKTNAEKSVTILKLIGKLQTKYVGQMATFLPNGWALDGTFHLIPKEEQQAADMFFDIYHNNEKHREDAMIAMTAIIYGCTLVVYDKRLYNRVNAHFPGRALWYDDFISLLKEYFSHSTNP